MTRLPALLASTALALSILATVAPAAVADTAPPTAQVSYTFAEGRDASITVDLDQVAQANGLPGDALNLAQACDGGGRVNGSLRTPDPVCSHPIGDGSTVVPDPDPCPCPSGPMATLNATDSADYVSGSYHYYADRRFYWTRDGQVTAILDVVEHYVQRPAVDEAALNGLKGTSWTYSTQQGETVDVSAVPSMWQVQGPATVTDGTLVGGWNDDVLSGVPVPGVGPYSASLAFEPFWVMTTPPSHGSLGLMGDRRSPVDVGQAQRGQGEQPEVVYTASSSFSGTDTFEIAACAGWVDRTACDSPRTVTITVTPSPAKVVQPISPPDVSGPPQVVAKDDVVHARAGHWVRLTPLANDSFAPTLGFRATWPHHPPRGTSLRVVSGGSADPVIAVRAKRRGVYSIPYRLREDHHVVSAFIVLKVRG